MNREMAVFSPPGAVAPRALNVGDFFSSVLAVPLLVASLTITTFDFAPDTEAVRFSTDWQTALRLAACVAFGVYGLKQLPRTADLFLSFPGAWMTLFAAWSVLTIPLSTSPVYSAASVFSLLCVMLFAPAVVLQLGKQKTLETMLNALLMFVGVTWVLRFTIPSLAQCEHIMPDGEVRYRFGNDAQQLGIQIAWAMALLLILCFARVRSWKSAVLLFPVLGVTLALTQSRTAAVAAITAVGVVIWQHLGGKQRVAAVMGGGALMVGMLGLWAMDVSLLDGDAMATRLSRSGDANDLKNLSGRDEIWEFVWERIVESPVFGWGYGCSRFALFESMSYPFAFGALHAHNLYLNVALCIGFPGAILLLAMIGQVALRAVKVPSAFPRVAAAVVIVTGLTEPLLFGPMPRSHTVIWLIAVFWQQMKSIDPYHHDEGL